VVIFNVEAASASTFLDWYRRRHLPDLVRAGFLSAHAFEAAEGGRRFVTVYEQDHDVLGGEAYAGVRAADARLAANESQVRDLQKGTYRQAWWSTATPAPPPIRRRWLSVLGVDVEEDAREGVLERLRRELASISTPGGDVHRLTVRLGGHPLFPESVAPPMLLLRESSRATNVLEEVRRRLLDAFPELPASAVTIASRYYAGGR
jgi:hypothetical protein